MQGSCYTPSPCADHNFNAPDGGVYLHGATQHTLVVLLFKFPYFSSPCPPHVHVDVDDPSGPLPPFLDANTECQSLVFEQDA